VNRQLRLVVFSESIISDIGNPTATTVRAMCQAFADLGHDVTHLEERGNPALTRMLQSRGYGPMRAFNEKYPHIRYRQYELPLGAERAVWFGREVATADAVVAYPGSPLGVIDELDARDNALLVRFWAGTTPDVRDLMSLWTEPAVLTRPAPGLRDALNVVAYDDIPELDRPEWGHLSAGHADADGWEYIPEVLLEERYQRSQTIALDETVDRARALLPVANGSATELVNRAGQTVEVITGIPPVNAARLRADRLAAEIDRILTDRAARDA
jgi:hypothetical protein